MSSLSWSIGDHEKQGSERTVSGEEQKIQDDGDVVVNNNNPPTTTALMAETILILAQSESLLESSPEPYSAVTSSMEEETRATKKEATNDVNILDIERQETSEFTKQSTSSVDMELLAERASVALAQHLQEEEEEDIGKQKVTEDKAEKEAEEDTPEPAQQPIELAEGGNVPIVQLTTLRQSTPQQRQQPSRPGAYMGAPGEDLQRTETLRFSLVGANTDPLVHVPNDMDEDSSLAEPSNTNVPNNNNQNTIISNDEQQLAVADLVEEDLEEQEQMTRPSANPVDLDKVREEQENQKWQLRKKFVWFLVAVCIVTFIIIVAAVVGTRNQETNETPTPTTPSPTTEPPSQVPSAAPSGVLDLLLDSLPNDTLVGINSGGSESPQWRAWQWLANHQNITNLQEWRKTQLFALACFFYSFEGDKWYSPIQERWMDDTKEECQWFSSGIGIFIAGKYQEYPTHIRALPCNEYGQFTSLHLEDLQLSNLAPYIPSEIVLLTSLSRLQLSYNDIAVLFSSLLPTEFYYHMTALTLLNLWENQISGQVATEIGLLSLLSSFWLDNNKINGQIPTELGLLTDLTEINLYVNQFSGLLPTELGQLTSLTALRLFENQLTGSVPAQLGYLNNLTVIVLDDNQLTGKLETELGLLSSLKIMNINSNELAGQIPTEFGLLTSLTALRLNDNMLTGPLGTELGLLDDVTTLWLDGNQFTGHIPWELGQMKHLNSLALNENLLTGSVLSELGQLTSLVYLWLNENQFTGQIPSEFGRLSWLEELDLSGNFLTSTIPTEVGMLASLRLLDLSNNSLTGPLPQQLNGTFGLRLEGNQLSGSVP